VQEQGGKLHASQRADAGVTAPATYSPLSINAKIKRASSGICEVSLEFKATIVPSLKNS
jgi:hypothetical protein